MSAARLAVALHETILADAREKFTPRADGIQPILACDVLKALGAVVADVIAGGADTGNVEVAFTAFMADLGRHLRQHGVPATISFGGPPAEASTGRLQ